jgi:hypothetical protein
MKELTMPLQEYDSDIQAAKKVGREEGERTLKVTYSPLVKFVWEITSVTKEIDGSVTYDNQLSRAEILDTLRNLMFKIGEYK